MIEKGSWHIIIPFVCSGVLRMDHPCPPAVRVSQIHVKYEDRAPCYATFKGSNKTELILVYREQATKQARKLTCICQSPSRVPATRLSARQPRHLQNRWSAAHASAAMCIVCGKQLTVSVVIVDDTAVSHMYAPSIAISNGASWLFLLWPGMYSHKFHTLSRFSQQFSTEW